MVQVKLLDPDLVRHAKSTYMWILVLILVIIAPPVLGARPWWDDGQPSYPPIPESQQPAGRSLPWWDQGTPAYPAVPRGEIPFSPNNNPMWRSQNGDMWGMFLFGGSPQVMDQWMDRMESWEDRMSSWADRAQGSWNRLTPFNDQQIPENRHEPWFDPRLMDMWNKSQNWLGATK